MARPGKVIEVPGQERAIRDAIAPPEAIRVSGDTDALKLYRKWWCFPHISLTLLVGVVLFGVALGLNVYRLGDPSIWYDEAFSAELARLPLPLLGGIIFGREPNMELYYLFLHGWLRLTAFFGLAPVEFVIRFPSAVFSACSTIVIFLLGRRFLLLSTAALGACLYALNFLQLTYAQQTRGYSLQLLLICISWYALLSLYSQPGSQRASWRWWLSYSLSMGLAIYTHLFSVLFLLAQIVMIVGLMLWPSQWRHRARQQFKGFVASVLVIVLLILPLVPVVLQGPKNGWLTPPDFGDLLHMFVMISGYDRPYLLLIMSCALLGSLLVVVALPWGKFRPSSQNSDIVVREDVLFGWGMLCWLVIPIVVGFVASQGTIQLFSSRYLVTILPALFLLVALCVAKIPERLRIRPEVMLVLLIVALQVTPFYYRSAQVEDWKPAVSWLQERYQQGDGLACYDNTMQQGCQIAVEYYLHAYPGDAHFTKDTPGAYSWENFGPALPGQSFDDAVNPMLLARFAKEHQRIFFIVGRVRDDAAAARAMAAQQWLDNNYRFVDQVVTRTVTVRLYLV